MHARTFWDSVLSDRPPRRRFSYLTGRELRYNIQREALSEIRPAVGTDKKNLVLITRSSGLEVREKR